MNRHGHDYHQGEPEYSPAQLVHDGCRACADIAAGGPAEVIAHLDPAAFAAAWGRAVTLQREGLGDLARAETPALRALAQVAVALERRGLPLGTLPGGLLPAEALAVGITRRKLAGGEPLEPGTTAMVLAALDRLTGIEDQR